MIKFLRGKPSLGFGGGSIAIRKAGTKQEEPLTIVALGLGTITQFAMRNKVAFIGTAEGATLYNVDTKVKNTYTLADLGVQSIDELDISAEEDKAIVRSGTTVYLYAVANGAIDIASKVTLPYAYCNFTDINNRAIAGNGTYPSASGTTKILKFTTGLTYTVAEVLGGSWNHVGKATPQGYGFTLSNHWHNENINTAYPINSETDNPTCEVLTNLTDMGISPNGTYTVARDGSNYKIYTNVASGAAALTKTVTGVGGTAFRFYSDTVIWALGKYSVKVYDFVNEEVLHTIGFGRTINTNFLAACNEKLYTIDKDNNLCIVAAVDQAEIPLPPTSLAIRYSLPEETTFPGDDTGTMIDTGIPQEDMANGYCIAMVITPAEWSSYRGIFGYHESLSRGLCGFQCEGNILNYTCFPSSGIQVNASAVPVNTKQQLVVNYDPETGLTTIYRNGIALGSTTMGGPAAFGNIIIGRAFVGGNRYYKGTISSFDIYDRAVTDEELATIFNSFTPESAT